MDWNDPNSTICKVCRELADPKTWLGIGVALMLARADMPDDWKNNQTISWLFSVLNYLFIGGGIILRRPVGPQTGDALKPGDAPASQAPPSPLGKP